MSVSVFVSASTWLRFSTLTAHIDASSAIGSRAIVPKCWISLGVSRPTARTRSTTVPFALFLFGMVLSSCPAIAVALVLLLRDWRCKQFPGGVGVTRGRAIASQDAGGRLCSDPGEDRSARPVVVRNGVASARTITLPLR